MTCKPSCSSLISEPTFTCDRIFKLLAAWLIVLSLTQISAFADHVHHPYYNNSIWQDQDLTELTGGGIVPNFGSAVAAFYTTPNKQLHVYYVDVNGDVHQLYYNNTLWTDEDLTVFTGGPAAEPYGISGFSIGNLQYVFYVSQSDDHVHELNYNNDNWSDQDLTAQVNGVQAIDPILAFATKPNNQFHVYYENALGQHHVHQLYFNGSSWSDDDLTALIGGAYCNYTKWMAGFAIGNLQEILCPGYGGFSGNLDMLHIYYNNASWTYEDLTYETGSLPAALWSGVGSFAVAKQGEVYGITEDGDFHQYTYKDGGWTDEDLTAVIGAPSNTEPGNMVAIPTTPNDQFHIFYAPSTEIYQLYFNGTSWSVEDLTGGAGQADPTAAMAGFAIGNLQHVFYLSTGD